MSGENDKFGWKEFLLVMGIVVACIAVIGSVFSLPIYPSWLRSVLLLALLAAWLVSLFKWPKGMIVCFIACGILVIYTIIGVILGNIDWVYPGGYKGP